VRTIEDGNQPGEKGHKKGHKNVPFWVLDGFAKISASPLERMAGTTRLELATSAVTAVLYPLKEYRGTLWPSNRTQIGPKLADPVFSQRPLE
jgi:hypothetical protein